MSLGTEIKIARVRQQLKSKELAERLGITRAYMSEIENDKASGLSLELFVRLCEVLDTTPNDLLQFQPKASAKPDAHAAR